MSLAEWVHRFNATCPDPGLDSYVRLDGAERAVSRTLIWIGALIGLEQCLHAVVLALRTDRRRDSWWRFSATPHFVLPLALTLAWAFFTALSVFMVAVTFRSNAAVLSKTVHVAVEASFLILLLATFGYTLLAALATTLVIVDLVMVLALPCADTIMLASMSGLVLDAANFLAYTWYGMSHPDDAVLWTLIGGLGWHALYLVTYVGVQRWRFLSDFARISMRMFGMLANLIADEFFLAAARHRLGLSRGALLLNVHRWKRVPFDPPRPVWTRDGLRLVGNVADDGQARVIPLYASNRTGYMLFSSWWRILCALWPFSSTSVEYTRRGPLTTLRYAVLCRFGVASEEVVDVQRVDESGPMLVPSFMVFRPILWLVLVVVGVGFGQLD